MSLNETFVNDVITKTSLLVQCREWIPFLIVEVLPARSIDVFLYREAALFIKTGLTDSSDSLISSTKL